MKVFLLALLSILVVGINTVFIALFSRDALPLLQWLCEKMLVISVHQHMGNIEPDIRQRYLNEWLADMEEHTVQQQPSSFRLLVFTLFLCFFGIEKVKQELPAVEHTKNSAAQKFIKQLWITVAQRFLRLVWLTLEVLSSLFSVFMLGVFVSLMIASGFRIWVDDGEILYVITLHIGVALGGFFGIGKLQRWAHRFIVSRQGEHSVWSSSLSWYPQEWAVKLKKLTRVSYGIINILTVIYAIYGIPYLIYKVTVGYYQDILYLTVLFSLALLIVERAIALLAKLVRLMSTSRQSHV